MRKIRLGKIRTAQLSIGKICERQVDLDKIMALQISAAKIYFNAGVRVSPGIPGITAVFYYR